MPSVIPHKVGRGNSEHISVRYVWRRSFRVNTQVKSVRLGRQTDGGLMKMYIAFRTVIPWNLPARAISVRLVEPPSFPDYGVIRNTAPRRFSTAWSNNLLWYTTLYGYDLCCHVITVAAEGCFRNCIAHWGSRDAEFLLPNQFQGNIQVPSVLHAATRLRTYLRGIVLTINSYFARIFACKARFTSIRPLIYAIAVYCSCLEVVPLSEGASFLNVSVSVCW